MEASSWYNEVDKQVAWEHPFNAYKFRTRMVCYQSPGAESIFTSEWEMGLFDLLRQASIVLSLINLKIQ